MKCTKFAIAFVEEQNFNPAKIDFSLSQPEIPVEPVGADYIEEVKGEGGKVVSFNCKLCECQVGSLYHTQCDYPIITKIKIGVDY